MAEMTEELKAEIIADCLDANRYKNYEIIANKVIRLVRALDSYRRRDSKGRFIKKEDNN